MSANPRDENKVSKESEKMNLDDAYDAEQENYIKENVPVIENPYIKQQSRLAWSTTTEISGRKATPNGQSKAKSIEDRVKLWKGHFQKTSG